MHETYHQGENQDNEFLIENNLLCFSDMCTSSAWGCRLGAANKGRDSITEQCQDLRPTYEESYSHS